MDGQLRCGKFAQTIAKYVVNLSPAEPALRKERTNVRHKHSSTTAQLETPNERTTGVGVGSRSRSLHRRLVVLY